MEGLADRLAAKRAQLTAGPRFATPGDLAVTLDRTTRQTPALELIDDALVDIAECRNDRLIISMPPQEGKSERTSRRFPTWMLTRDPELRVAIVSYADALARRWGRTVRNDITSNYDHLGITIRPDTSAANEWQLDGHRGGVVTAGIGSGLTGRPVDLLIIDDPLKDRQEADSEVYRQRCWDWWTDVATPRLAPGAPVILILTRWHEDDLAGRLLAADDGVRWRVINIPALADHDPAKGQTDPLGREPGEWLHSARGRTDEQWEQIRVSAGSRTFTSLYQGRPSPDAGDVFQRHWWRRYETPLWTDRGDGSFVVDGDGQLSQSWDMAFKDTKSSDYVVGQVWLRRGPNAYLLDQVRGRLSFTATADAVRKLSAKWPQAAMKLVEDKANGTAVIDSLQREIGGIVAVTPHESKYARASAVSPYVEAGNVHLPASHIALPGCEVDGLIDECASFPNGVHDDQVDALSQALGRLLLNVQPQWHFPKPADQGIVHRAGVPVGVPMAPGIVRLPKMPARRGWSQYDRR